MRLVGLLFVVAIIGYWWSHHGGPAGSVSKIDEELLATPAARPALVSPNAPPQQSQPASSGLRRPIDRTRSVLEQVKARNGNGEF